MGATWISWRTTLIITVLQIQAAISIKTKAVTGVEGQEFTFTCKYSLSWQGSKYLCHETTTENCKQLIWTDKQNQWVREKRFSLYDNTTGAFFIVKVDKLLPEDSGSYMCGVDVNSGPDHMSVIQLNVSRANPPQNPTHNKNGLFTSPKELTVDKLNMPLFLTAVMCVSAILFVCLFTICLLGAVKHQRSHSRSRPRPNRETSSDYETMMPGVGTEPEPCCTSSAPDCTALPPPPDLCSHFTSKQRESAVTLGLSEYVDVDVPGHICQYQHLDLSRLEEHVYHSLQGNSGPKDGPLGVKEQINC
ncbi:CMRF35-like molecule 8 [Lates japonicus]